MSAAPLHPVHAECRDYVRARRPGSFAYFDDRTGAWWIECRLTGAILANCGATEGAAWSVARGAVAAERPLGATQAAIAAKVLSKGADLVEAGLHRGRGRTGKLRPYGALRRNAANALAERGLVRLEPNHFQTYHRGFSESHSEIRVLPARAPATA